MTIDLKQLQKNKVIDTDLLMTCWSSVNSLDCDDSWPDCMSWLYICCCRWIIAIDLIMADSKDSSLLDGDN